MRHPIKTWLASLLLVGITAGPALAVSIDDLVNLKSKGVSDAILIALIEADGTIFRLSAPDILNLKKRGLSDDVVLAMINSAKPKPDAAAPRAAMAAPEAETAPRNDAEPYHDEYVGRRRHAVDSRAPVGHGGATSGQRRVPIVRVVSVPLVRSDRLLRRGDAELPVEAGDAHAVRPDQHLLGVRRGAPARYMAAAFRRVVQPSPVPTPHVGLPPNTPLPKNTPLRRN
jgi:hypothetical protein